MNENDVKLLIENTEKLIVYYKEPNPDKHEVGALLRETCEIIDRLQEET